MTAEEFFKKEDCENNIKYEVSEIENWYFGKEDMVIFAEAYHRYKIGELLAKAILKAKPNLNKIKDVDAFIDEVKGI